MLDNFMSVSMEDFLGNFELYIGWSYGMDGVCEVSADNGGTFTVAPYSVIDRLKLIRDAAANSDKHKHLVGPMGQVDLSWISLSDFAPGQLQPQLEKLMEGSLEMVVTCDDNLDPNKYCVIMGSESYIELESNFGGFGCLLDDGSHFNEGSSYEPA